MKFSPNQNDALKRVNRWFHNDTKENPIFRVFGYAGTGKTSIAKYFAEMIDGEVLYAAFTGKAALAMSKAGCHGASTIHSMIYTPKVDKRSGDVTFILNRGSDLRSASLLIIDECSMVNSEMAYDLLSFKVPILVLGDPAQLPPVAGAGFFTEVKPDVMLTEIHRQAGDNPIIRLATDVRNRKVPSYGKYGDSSIVNEILLSDLTAHDQILVGRNATRTRLNTKIRKILGFEGDMPKINDKLICLKNDKELGIFNGGMFTMQGYNRTKLKGTNFSHLFLESDDFADRSVNVKVHKGFFDGDYNLPPQKNLSGSHQFDYGYAITTHKSQGSQWDSVLVYDESGCFRDEKYRWLYTAITRAAESVKVYIP